MRGGLGPVCATGIYRSTGHMEFPKFRPKFFLNGKRPKVLLPPDPPLSLEELTVPQEIMLSNFQVTLIL